MAQPLKPKRGGFLRPFGCGWFIREFLLGKSPYGSQKINPAIGSPQADVFYNYKTALLRAYAEDRATRQEERQSARENRALDPERIDSLIVKFLLLTPYKSSSCVYHSFVIYFSMLKRLGWVEATGRETPSSFQDNYLLGQPRRYYRLTELGKKANDLSWSNPRLSLYGKG